MNHIDLLKRAFTITWRFRALWVFGFFLALCSGGGGGGGSGNFTPPTGDDFDPGGVMPDIDAQLVIILIVVLVCLALLAALVGIVVRAVTRTAIIGMVRQAEESGQVTVRDGWAFGWSRRAWRLFLVSFVIGVPVFIVTFILILLALSPLLLLISGDDAAMVFGIVLTVLAFLFVLFVILVISAVLTPIFELSYRQVVFEELGIIDTIRAAIALVRARLKDVAVIWLLMLGVGMAWFFVALIVVLPLSLLAALIVGGIPAALVYLITGSWLGTAITGIPLAVLALVLVSSFFAGLYYVYQSSVWTLTYLKIRPPEIVEPAPDGPDGEPTVPDEGLQPAA